MDEDVTQLTDEELQQRISGEEPAPTPEPVETPVETPEPTAEPAPAEEPEAEAPAVEEQPPTEEQPISRREQLRVNQLLQKYGDPSVRQAPSQPQASQVPQGTLDYSQELEASPEVIQQLEADRLATSQAQYQQGLQQGIQQVEVSGWRRDLKYEAPTVEKDFPFLNPRDKENFKPAAADAMTQKYLRFIGYNPGDPAQGIPESVRYPDVGYRDFVESEMEFVDELASQKSADTAKNIARQAAATGLRPDGGQAKRLNLNQAPQNMSIEELYASIGQKPPKQ